jgi:hypothetical protein
METSRPDVGEAIRETRDITKEIEEKLVAAIAEFKEIFTAQAAGV